MKPRRKKPKAKLCFCPKQLPRFKPGWRHKGGFIQVQWDDVPYYTHYMNNRVTLLQDRRNRRVIGCQIMGMKK